ncbi:hypothetical protein LTR42_009506 [Elasticomyces elasticus]|nr:hypothetical protein LTR42_009506 [Elasticomyces elasticus]
MFAIESNSARLISPFGDTSEPCDGDVLGSNDNAHHQFMEVQKLRDDLRNTRRCVESERTAFETLQALSEVSQGQLMGLVLQGSEVAPSFAAQQRLRDNYSTAHDYCVNLEIQARHLRATEMTAFAIEGALSRASACLMEMLRECIGMAAPHKQTRPQSHTRTDKADQATCAEHRSEPAELQAYLEALAYGEMLEDELESLEGGYRKWAGELERGEEQDITMEVWIHTFVAEYPEQRQDLESQMEKQKQKVLIEQSRAKCVAAGYDPIPAEQEYTVGRPPEPYADHLPMPEWDFYLASGSHRQ